MTPTALAPEMKPEVILTRARRLGLTPSRMPSLEGGQALQLAPVNVEDLLLRPERQDRLPAPRRLSCAARRRWSPAAAARSVRKSATGSSTYGIARLMVIENSEPALHAVLESLAAKDSRAEIDGRIADIRDRERIIRLITQFKPDIVFHAAALKHVPLLERDWDEGIKTNVFGSINVADAAARRRRRRHGDDLDRQGDRAGLDARRHQAPRRNVLPGARRRRAGARRAGRPPMRLISVRFGNVLASNGSVVPKFKAQIESRRPGHRHPSRHGALLHDHPRGLRPRRHRRLPCARRRKAADVSVYVLNMGQPVKIVDLAERMIRLSGLEPGRDIEIVFTGIRPGERLNEMLFAADEPTADIGIAGIVAARPVNPALDTLRAWLAALEQGLGRDDREAIYRVLRDAVPGFRKEAV